MAELICWRCGVEPDDVVELVQFGGEKLRVIPNWPPGDHPHAERPPSPAQLEQAGHVSLMRIVDAAAGMGA
jgi:hypothetical protein